MTAGRHGGAKGRLTGLIETGWEGEERRGGGLSKVRTKKREKRELVRGRGLGGELGQELRKT